MGAFLQETLLHYLCQNCSTSVTMPNPATDVVSVCPGCGRGVPLRDGILLIQDQLDARDEAQPGEYHDLLVRAEAKHFWFDARNRLILSTIRDQIGPLIGRSLLDVGCGTGFVSAAAERAGMEVCGLDMQVGDLRYARERVLGPLVFGSAHHLPFSEQFDVVLLCDVIEHVSDDQSVLREASRSLKPGGTMIVTVPALQWLWTSVDDVSAHKRRYTRGSLTAALAAAGLTHRLVNYFNTLLLPAQIAQRLLIKNRPVTTREQRAAVALASIRVPPAPINAALWLVAVADVALRRVRSPIGSSLIAVATRG